LRLFLLNDFVTSYVFMSLYVYYCKITIIAYICRDCFYEVKRDRMIE